MLDTILMLLIAVLIVMPVVAILLTIPEVKHEARRGGGPRVMPAV